MDNIFIFLFLVVIAALAVYLSEKSGGGSNKRSDNSSDKSHNSSHKVSERYDVDDDFEKPYVTRAQRRREQEKRNKKECDRRKWLDDYDTEFDEDGNEHSLDYDNYCDECDEYHEE